MEEGGIMGRNYNASAKLSIVIHKVLLHITGIEKVHRE
jgi:hypothetical protein